MENKIIELKNLEKKFITAETEVTALDNINLDIYEGDIFGIIGLSGAGKSTLVRCINYLETPTSGKVIIDGKDLGRLKESDLHKARRNMGMIFQQFNLLMQRNALENISFPLEISGVSKREAKKRAKELLELVELEGKERAYPSQLSGGQKQRIAIARALATNPKILLCDEATSALDPTTTRSILKLLKDINQKLGITVIVITHEMSVIEEICNKVAVIDKSNIAEVGDVKNVFANPQSDIAKKLIFGEKAKQVDFENGRKLPTVRIVFDGRSSFEPVVSEMILECKATINIIYADMRDINGVSTGQMIIQLPPHENIQEKILDFLRLRKITFEEVVNK